MAIPQPFLHTVESLSSFLTEAGKVEDWLASRLSEVTATFAVHDSQLAALKILSEALLLEAEECSTTDEVMRCESFDGFASVEPIPPKLFESGAATHLIGYIRSTPARAKKRAMDVAREQAERSPAMDEFCSEADIKRRASIEEHSAALARSDHLPIVVHLQTTMRSQTEHTTETSGAQADRQHRDSSPADTAAAGILSSSDSALAAPASHSHLTEDRFSEFRVVSHNVQELIEDGVNMYASCLASHQLRMVAPAGCAVRSARELVATLVGAMLSPAVRETQREMLLAFLETQVPKCDAVCLQELSNELVASLESACAAHAPHWYFHASQKPPRKSSSGGCDARTAIISHREFVPEADCVVTFQSSSATPTARTRRYATATFSPSGSLAPVVTLVSTHVLHSSGKSTTFGAAQGNVSNIHTSEEQVLALLRPRLTTANVVLLVGDFNGPLVNVPNAMARALSEARDEAGIRIWQHCPLEATQLTRQGAATPACDGAVAMSMTAATVKQLRCCLSLSA
jgi:exonuclease III